MRKGKERDDMISCSFFYRKFESHLSGCADKSQSKKMWNLYCCCLTIQILKNGQACQKEKVGRFCANERISDVQSTA